MNRSSSLIPVVDAEYIYIGNYKFNHDGHFLSESQYLALHAEGTGVNERKKLFKKIGSLKVCAICYTIAKDIDHIPITQE